MLRWAMAFTFTPMAPSSKANYIGTGVPSGLNVADTPSYTQDLALTYQDHGFDLGVIEKRVGTTTMTTAPFTTRRTSPPSTT